MPGAPKQERSRPRLFRRPAPCYSGSRCFMGISFSLALVEGLLAAAGATWVDARSAQWNAGAGRTAGPTA